MATSYLSPGLLMMAFVDMRRAFSTLPPCLARVWLSYCALRCPTPLLLGLPCQNSLCRVCPIASLSVVFNISISMELSNVGVPRLYARAFQLRPRPLRSLSQRKFCAHGLRLVPSASKRADKEGTRPRWSGRKRSGRRPEMKRDRPAECYPETSWRKCSNQGTGVWRRLAVVPGRRR